MIDLTFRSFSRARWITVATSRGIYGANGRVQNGFAVDEIGAPVLVNAVRNGRIIITPAVLDTWFWTNLRIYSGARQAADDDSMYPGEVEDGFRFTKSKLVKFVRDQSALVNLPYQGQTIRAYQFGAAANRIQLLDPRDYAQFRCREWLGGMSY